MNPFAVEEFNEFPETPPQVFFTVIVSEKHPLVFQSSPGALNKYVVLAPSYAVHADIDTIELELFHEGGTRVLAAEVRVEDCRAPIGIERILHALKAVCKAVGRASPRPGRNPSS